MYPEDFVPPSVENVAPLYPEKQASDQAFYAARSYSDNPTEDYQKIYTELSQKGSSELFSISKDRWIKEQDVANKQAIVSLIEDPNVDVEAKKDALVSYGMGGTISPDIKEKYIQKTALETKPVSLEQVKAQQDRAASVSKLSTELNRAIAKDQEEAGTSKFVNYLDGLGLATLDVGFALGGGIMGVLDSIWEWDAVAGQKLANKIIDKSRSDAYKVLKPSQKALDVKNDIMESISVLGVPSEKIGEWVTENTGSANAGLVAKVPLDPLNFVGVGTVKGLTSGAKQAINLGARKTAPINAASVANPNVAADLIKEGFADTTDKAFKSMGTDKGQAVNDAVLPKIMSPNEVKLMPDVAEYFAQSDAAFQEMFKDNRFDVNAQPLAESRLADLDSVAAVLRDERATGYMQNQSFLSNIDGNIYEGKAIFGKTDKYYFSNLTEVAQKYNALKETIKDLPLELKKDLAIVDKITGRRYVDMDQQGAAALENTGTFSELVNDPKYKDVANTQLAVEWSWKKEYDELGALLFGPDSVTSSLSFGPGPLKNLDVSQLARSDASSWLLNPGTFPKWFEQSIARIAPRAARAQNVISSNFKRYVATTKHPKELDELVHLAEKDKQDHYSVVDIATKYPYLSQAQAKDLFVSYSTWRRTTHYLHSLVNLKQRRDLYRDGFTRGLYVEDKYVGPINENWRFRTKDQLPDQVWDYDLNMPFKFTLNAEKILEGTYDVGGKKLVQLKNPYVDEASGHIYEYGLIGGAKSKADLLPERVVPRTPGYSPIKTTEHFFIQKTPKEMVINGIKVTDPNRLATHSQTIGAAATRAEAKKMEQALQAKNEDYTVSIKQDRSVNFNTVIDDLQTADNLNRNAMQRGERLPTLTGMSRVEDRMMTLTKTIRSLVNQNAWDPFEKNFNEAFVASYGPFLRDGAFPRVLSDISAPPNASLDTIKRVEEARAIYKKYAKMKSFGTMSDEVWQKSLHTIADLIDGWRVPSDIARTMGNKGESVFSSAKKLASVLFINLAPQRQWIVQMQTLLEMAALYPIKAVNVFRDTLAYRGALLAEAEVLSGIADGKASKYFKENFAKMSSDEKVEFTKTLEAIKKSGLMESIDLNMLVHGVFTDLNDPLIRSTASKVAGAPLKAGKILSAAGRSVGFDIAESTNRLGLWLVAKDLWKQNNPGKDWTTQRAIEEISYEEWRLSGSMSRAGGLAYQEGLLSTFMQFAAISQKLTMNVFQDNATMLSPSQRARLAAVRLLMYGPRYGLPIGGLVDTFINNTDNDETKKLLKQAERGLLDVALNSLLQTATGEPADVNFAKSFTPYSDFGLPTIEVFFEMAKIFSDKPTAPRFPALGAITAVEETLGKLNGWFTARPMNTPEEWTKALNEVAKLASGWSNISKMQIMLATHDKYTKLGSPLGLKATVGESIAQAFGMTTFREDDLFAAAKDLQDRNALIKTMSEDIHKSLVSLYKAFPEDADKEAEYLSSFVSVLKDSGWGTQDIDDLLQATIELDKRSQQEMGTSVLMKILEKTSAQNAESLDKARGHILSVHKNDPELKQLFDLMQGKGNP